MSSKKTKCTKETYLTPLTEEALKFHSCIPFWNTGRKPQKMFGHPNNITKICFTFLNTTHRVIFPTV